MAGPPMYYSYFSTGNVKIDSEHANIDCMIDLCRNSEGEWAATARLLISAFANHLDSEEKIGREACLNMTREHLQEHGQLRTRLDLIEKQVDRAELDKESFLSTLRDMLFYHISNYDKHLSSN
jgi:hemerythrin-like metal-binding protein